MDYAGDLDAVQSSRRGPERLEPAQVPHALFGESVILFTSRKPVAFAPLLSMTILFGIPLVVALVVVVIDEGADLSFKISGQEVTFQENTVLHGLVPKPAL